MTGWKRLQPWLAMAFIVAIAAIWFATTSFPLVDKSQVLSSAALQPVSAGHELIQTIKAPTDKISRVDLILGKPHPGTGGELKLQLVDVTVGEEGETVRTGDTLREVILGTSSFNYTTRYSFEFDQVDVTPGKTYGVRLTGSDSEEAAVRPGGWTVDNYNGGRLYIDGKSTSEDFYFALFHNAGAGEILAKMKPWRPFPFNQSLVIVGIFLVGAATFGWLLWVIACDQIKGQVEGEYDRNPDGGESGAGSTGGGVPGSSESV